MVSDLKISGILTLASGIKVSGYLILTSGLKLMTGGGQWFQSWWLHGSSLNINGY